jgi:hypothetical protein
MINFPIFQKAQGYYTYGTEQLLISQTTYNTAQQITTIHPSSNSSMSAIGESFRVLTGNYRITNVSFYLIKYGSPTTNLTMYLYNASSHKPSGAALASSTPVNSSSLTGSWVWYNFSFPTAPYTIFNNTWYCLEIQTEGGVIDESGNEVDGRLNTTTAYEGQRTYYQNSAWGTVSNDMAFIIYGKPQLEIYDVTYQVNTGGDIYVNNTIKANNTVTTYNVNDAVNLSSVNSANYHFQNFTWDLGSSTSNFTAVSVAQNMTIWCYFDVDPTVTFHINNYTSSAAGSITANGTNKPDRTATQYPPNTVLHLVATPDSTHAFANFTYDSSSTTSNPYDLTTLDNNMTVWAFFDPNATSRITFANVTDSGYFTYWATDMASQRRIFYAEGRYWMFYCNFELLPSTGEVVYTSSLDGVTWAAPENIAVWYDLGSGQVIYHAAYGSSNAASTWFDGVYVHFASGFDQPLTYRRGQPLSNGTMIWDASPQMAFNNTQFAIDYGYYFVYPLMPVVTTDSQGYPYIAFMLEVWTDASHFTWQTWVTKSSTNDGTWTTAAGFPHQLLASGSENPSIVPLNSGVYTIFTNSSQGLNGIYYDGTTWGSIQSLGTVSSYTTPLPLSFAYSDYSVLNFSSSVGVVWNDNGVLKYANCSASGFTPTTLLTLTVGYNRSVIPEVSYIPQTDTIEVFWADIGSGNLYSLSCVDGTWTTTPNLLYQSPDGICNGQITSACQYSYGRGIGIAFESGTWLIGKNWMPWSGTPYNHTVYFGVYTGEIPVTFSSSPEINVAWSEANLGLNGTTPSLVYLPFGIATFEALNTTIVINSTYRYAFNYWMVNDSVAYSSDELSLVLSGATTLNLVYTGYSTIVIPFPFAYPHDALNLTWYFRSDIWTILETLGYKLQTVNTHTATSDMRTDPVSKDVSYGFRVWVKDVLNSTTELTAGTPEAIMTKTTNSSSMVTAYWNCPSFSALVSAVRIDVYQRFNDEGWSLRRIFISKDDLLIKFPAATWTFHFYINRTAGSTYSTMWHGSYTTYDSRVDIQYNQADPWETAMARLWKMDLTGFLFTPWTYWLGDIFWTLLLFAFIVMSYLWSGSLKLVLAVLWILGGSGSVLWALIPAIALHVAALMLAIAMAWTFFRLIYGKR